MDLLVCVGSSCHLKNSKGIIDKLNELIASNDLNNKVSLKGSFCMEKCGKDGVSVRVSDKIFNLKIDEVEEFFKNEVIDRLN